MLRRLAPSVLLVLSLIGCSKKPDAPAGGGGDGATPAAERRGVDSDPNTTYTFKIRDVREGDKSQVVYHEASTENQHSASTSTIKREKRFEYTEEILAMPEGSPIPSRLTRDYAVAQSLDDKSGQMQPYSFQGKTVLFEKGGAFYRYTVEGKPLSRSETMEFDDEFKKAEKARIEALLPDGPVKVGGHWPISREIVPAFGADPSSVDFSKSMLSGKFNRAYTLDGKQWGQIAFDFDLVIKPDVFRGNIRREDETVKVTGTCDVVIDGSARDSILKATVKGSFTGRLKAAKTKVELDGTIERTVRTAK